MGKKATISSTPSQRSPVCLGAFSCSSFPCLSLPSGCVVRMTRAHLLQATTALGVIYAACGCLGVYLLARAHVRSPPWTLSKLILSSCVLALLCRSAFLFSSERWRGLSWAVEPTALLPGDALVHALNELPGLCLLGACALVLLRWREALAGHGAVATARSRRVWRPWVVGGVWSVTAAQVLIWTVFAVGDTATAQHCALAAAIVQACAFFVASTLVWMSGRELGFKAQDAPLPQALRSAAAAVVTRLSALCAILLALRAAITAIAAAALHSIPWEGAIVLALDPRRNGRNGGGEGVGWREVGGREGSLSESATEGPSSPYPASDTSSGEVFLFVLFLVLLELLPTVLLLVAQGGRPAWAGALRAVALEADEMAVRAGAAPATTCSADACMGLLTGRRADLVVTRSGARRATATQRLAREEESMTLVGTAPPAARKSYGATATYGAAGATAPALGRLGGFGEPIRRPSSDPDDDDDDDSRDGRDDSDQDDDDRSDTSSVGGLSMAERTLGDDDNSSDDRRDSTIN
jgi:Protein of unknown function (DUF1084)